MPEAKTETKPLPGTAYLTEQAKSTKADPVGTPATTGDAELVDVAAGKPYPTGKPPKRSWAQINGFEAA